MHRLMSTFWARGGQLALLDQWAAKDAALAAADVARHPAEELSMEAWLRLADAEQAQIITAYLPRRAARQPQAA